MGITHSKTINSYPRNYNLNDLPTLSTFYAEAGKNTQVPIFKFYNFKYLYIQNLINIY